MSITITIEEAQAKLKEIIRQLAPGDEIIITENHQTVARLRSEFEQPVKRPPPGLGKGSILYMSPDFDDPFDRLLIAQADVEAMTLVSADRKFAS